LSGEGRGYQRGKEGNKPPRAQRGERGRSRLKCKKKNRGRSISNPLEGKKDRLPKRGNGKEEVELIEDCFVERKGGKGIDFEG